jgi:hypothetical protein
LSKKLSFEIVSIALTTLTVFGMTNPALAQVTTSGGTSADVEGNSAPGLLTDRFTGGLGTYVVSNKVKATLNGTATGSNQQVDFGHTFGEDGSVNRFRFDFLWRINPKHHVRLVYFQNNVTRNRTLDKDFAWGDRTFQANGTITAGTKLGVYEASYEYAFVRQPNFELAAGAGIHYLNMSFKLAGNATVTDANGNVSSASYTSTSSNLPAPLPVIGVRALWAVTPSIFIEPELQIFKFKYDAYDGNWTDLRIAAKWMFSRHFGVGLGYDNFHVNVDVTKSNFNGNVNLGYSGLQAMLVGSY